MEPHLALDDFAFEKSFKDCLLPPEVFTHEAHLRLAWLYLSNYGKNEAIRRICTELKAYVAFLGVSEKYHETLTVAAIKMVHHFMQKSESNRFEAFLREFPQIKSHCKELLMTHYSENIFTMEEARKSYVAPDLQAFD